MIERMVILIFCSKLLGRNTFASIFKTGNCVCRLNRKLAPIMKSQITGIRNHEIEINEQEKKKERKRERERERQREEENGRERDAKEK